MAGQYLVSLVVSDGDPECPDTNSYFADPPLASFSSNEEASLFIAVFVKHFNSAMGREAINQFVRDSQ